MDRSSDQLAPHWLAAAQDPTISARLESIYTLVADQIEARAPSCWASGRCCNFAKTGHRLYVTGLEAAYTVSRLAPHAAGMTPAPSPLSADSLDAAIARGDCPFLAANLCSIHTIKPLGCRIYFCDRSAQTWQHDLSERALSLIRALHDDFDIEYRYGEWREMLRHFT